MEALVCLDPIPEKRLADQQEKPPCQLTYIFLDMLPEIGISKNVSQLFGICIPLAIPMYIEITYD